MPFASGVFARLQKKCANCYNGSVCIRKCPVIWFLHPTQQVRYHRRGSSFKRRKTTRTAPLYWRGATRWYVLLPPTSLPPVSHLLPPTSHLLTLLPPNPCLLPPTSVPRLPVSYLLPPASVPLPPASYLIRRERYILAWRDSLARRLHIWFRGPHSTCPVVAVDPILPQKRKYFKQCERATKRSIGYSVFIIFARSNWFIAVALSAWFAS